MWIVLPTYEEARSVATVIGGLRTALGSDARILVVDDASPDGTGELAERLGATVLHRARRRGLGPALQAGFAFALGEGADVVVQMDADGSHDPAALPALLAALDAGAGLAVGSRYAAGGAIAHWPPWRRALSRAGCAYARRVLRVPVRDLTSGMKAWRTPALAATRFPEVRGRGYAFQVELTYRALLAGVPVTEVPITFTERRAGASKLSGAIALEAAWRVPVLRLQSRRVIADLTRT
jgi:dolichol-phosphate mannosyltransferase